MNEDGGLYSRSGRSDAGGKLTETINTPVSAELKDAFVFLAKSQRLGVAEYVREVLESHAFGEQLRIQRMLQDRAREGNERNVS